MVGFYTLVICGKSRSSSRKLPRVMRSIVAVRRRLSLVLLALAVVLAYRLLIQGMPARLVTLAILASVALLATPMASGGPRAGEEQYPLLTYVLIEGAKSPLILSLIGAVLAHLVLAPSWKTNSLGSLVGVRCSSRVSACFWLHRSFCRLDSGQLDPAPTVMPVLGFCWGLPPITRA